MSILQASDKSRSMALILCIIGFIGVAGIHRFYAGKVGTGILFLLTGGLFGLGTIYDLIKIATNTFTDALGNPITRD
ncbi:MAG: TM2 domain-containing protein [Psychrilyobacter sp.]|nr:TM2 domain-containing protein [Psychrilyobacter sp.]